MRTLVEGDLQRTWPHIRLRPITATALETAKRWNIVARVAWDWTQVVKRPKANRFDLAIWHGDVLCGLAWGPAEADAVAIEYLQGNPDPAHPLKRCVILIALALLETQALAAGASETRLLGPLPGLVPIYGRHGYRAVARRGVLTYLRNTGA